MSPPRLRGVTAVTFLLSKTMEDFFLEVLEDLRRDLGASLLSLLQLERVDWDMREIGERAAESADRVETASSWTLASSV